MDASVNSMVVIGVLILPVEIRGFNSSTRVEFIVGSSSYYCVWLGRNFMSEHGNVSFDFVNGKVKLGAK